MASTSEASENIMEVINIGSVLFIDDDEGVRNAVSAHLRRLGLENIDLAEDGEAAWQLLQERRYDLIITDWKMPKISGLALANRIREADSTRNTPILVLTGYLNRSDFRLMTEFPLIATLEKPYQIGELATVINGLMKEASFYSKESEVIAKTFAEFANDPQIFISNLLSLLNLTNKPVPLAIKGSRILQEHGFYDAAESILNIILSADPKCLLALHELGKCYLRQRRYAKAKEVLSAANESCPNNLERLCLLGKANLNSRSFAEAAGNFQEALAVDKGHIRAKQGMTAAKTSIDAADISRGMLSQSFISALNARAILKVHGQKYADALELYDSALEYADDTEIQIKLSFNMGLAFLRWGKPSEALKHFQKCAGLSQQQFGKAMRNIAIISSRYGIASESDTDESRDDETIGGGASNSDVAASLLYDLTTEEEIQKEYVFDDDDLGIN